jgi:hypothetical protein
LYLSNAPKLGEAMARSTEVIKTKELVPINAHRNWVENTFL